MSIHQFQGGEHPSNPSHFSSFAKVPVITKNRQYWDLNVIIFFLKQIA